MAHPFLLTGTQIKNANLRFTPAKASGQLTIVSVVSSSGQPTIVSITSPYDEKIELVATFLPAKPLSNGVRRVSGKQIVHTNVEIDFSRVLPLCWLASVYRQGDLSANLSYQVYSSDTDYFSLSLNDDITLTHRNGVWQTPTYDAQKYQVCLGFGLGLDYVRWGYSVLCQPSQKVCLGAGSYELARSNGQEHIGDPVASNQPYWDMPMGFSYTLAFDACGNGCLAKH